MRGGEQYDDSRLHLNSRLLESSRLPTSVHMVGQPPNRAFKTGTLLIRSPVLIMDTVLWRLTVAWYF